MPRTTPPQPHQFHPQRPGLVRPMHISEEPGLTPRVVRDPTWRRTSRGLYVPADLPEEHAVAQRIAEASMLCPADGAITGWAALRWLGGRYFGETYAGQQLPITITVGRNRVRKRPGIAVSSERVLPDEIVEVDGVRITVPVYSATFEARHAVNGELAVQVLDMALMLDLTSIDELIDFTLRRLFTTHGIAQLQAAICLASENCWSPPESTMRVLWEVELRRGRPLCNWPVFDRDGRHLGTPDLIDPVAGVVGEYDGSHHLEPEQREHDAERAAGFRQAGLEYVDMTVPDLSARGPYLDRLSAAHARGRRRAGRRRRWTTTLPSYWVPTHTVAHRRALTSDQRDRYLGWQRLAQTG